MTPITDPKYLVDYLERFYSLVHGGMDGKIYNHWTTGLRTDLAAISDEQIRQRAFELFADVEKAGYVLGRNPEMLNDIVLPTIRRLIDYLKEAFSL